MKLALLATLWLTFSNCEDQARTVVETKYGKVEGDVVETHDVFLVATFKGIPFGVAERFQKPKPVEPWKDTLQARQWANRCLQHQVFAIVEPPMPDDANEDCLYLNVFSPHQKTNQAYPVMVWMYGGGFAEGSSTFYGQDGIVNWLVPKGVIVVTLNYRVGPFGFFSTGNSDAPGNYGLWDQTLALQWVKDNIAQFGGDPKKVTIFGESAGAISVSLLSVSPHSRDLFQQVISMSGSSYLPWFSPESQNTVQASHILSAALGCGPLQGEATDSKRVLECLRSKSAEDITSALYTYRPFGNFEYVGFVPISDGDFFPDSIESLQASAPAKPLITGITTDEMGLFVTPPHPMDTEWQLKDPDSFDIDELLEKLAHFFPEQQYHHYTPLVRQLALNHYVDSLGDRRNNTFLVERYKELFGDFLFAYPSYKEALIRHQRGSKVWLYSFDYYDQALFPQDYKFKGAQHFLEMPYIFNMDPLFHPNPFEGNDKMIKDIMTTLWTNFAKYGEPTPQQSPLHKALKWDPINDHTDHYLHIGVQTEQKPRFNRRMVSFWHELLPKVIKFLNGFHSASRHSAMKTEL